MSRLGARRQTKRPVPDPVHVTPRLYGGRKKPVVVRGAPFPTTIRLDIELVLAEVVDAGHGAKNISFTIASADRDSGARQYFKFEARYTPEALQAYGDERRMWATVVHNAVSSMLEHENMEAIVIEGSRPFDPHRGEKQ